MTKAEIKNKFYELKKWGYEFKNFQSHKKMPFGSRGFCDLFIVAPTGFIFFIDIKTKNDVPSPKQIEFRAIINSRCKEAVHLFGTEENTDRLINSIMQKQYQSLLDYEKPKKLSRISK